MIAHRALFSFRSSMYACEDLAHPGASCSVVE